MLNKLKRFKYYLAIYLYVCSTYTQNLSNKWGLKMQEQDERISARLENKMINEIDALVNDEKYSNRSDFLRTAVRTQIDSQQIKDTITVKLDSMELRAIDGLVRKYYGSREVALTKIITRFLTDENIRKLVKDLDSMTIVAGDKIEADLESKTPRQILTK